MNRKGIAIVVLIIVVLLIFNNKCESPKFFDITIGSSSNSDDESNYPDDTYCADVEYYNPNTGTRHTYTLNVDVENNELTVIHWPNGGWLDDSHFDPQKLDSDGSCSFISDKLYEYNIQITGSECSYTDADSMDRDVQSDEESLKCPECGFSKYSYDDYCDSCKRKMTCPECRGRKYKYDEVCSSCKDKAEHTCKRCGQHDSFMWSSDDLCSDCKRADEEKEREEQENNN